MRSKCVEIVHTRLLPRVRILGPTVTAYESGGPRAESSPRGVRARAKNKLTQTVYARHVDGSPTAEHHPPRPNPDLPCIYNPPTFSALNYAALTLLNPSSVFEHRTPRGRFVLQQLPVWFLPGGVGSCRVGGNGAEFWRELSWRLWLPA